MINSCGANEPDQTIGGDVRSPVAERNAEAAHFRECDAQKSNAITANGPQLDEMFLERNAMNSACLDNVAATGRQWEPLVGPDSLGAATIKQ